MEEPPNTDVRSLEDNLSDKLARLDASIEHLSSDVTSLKLELATLVSALRELQRHRPVAETRAIRPVSVAPPVRPSPAPAAIVVLLAMALLSWQLLIGSNPDSPATGRLTSSPPVRVAAPTSPALLPETAATEPPPTPLVTPTVYKGTLTVSASAPGARVYVNRKDVGVAPVRVRNLKAGAHLVWIESEGHRRWTRVITVPAERVTRVTADLEPLPADVH